MGDFCWRINYLLVTPNKKDLFNVNPQIQDLFFSVIIPTRNRPELFKQALDSVLEQTFDSYEVIVVNDGTTEEFIDQYKELEKQYSDRVSFQYLIHRPNGHGQSYSMNQGAYAATGQYLCFLDDDDYWIDCSHLARAHASISGAVGPVDLYYTNQKAYFADGSPQKDPVWIEDLKPYLEELIPDEQGTYTVSVPLLLKSNGFAHLNCSIVRRELYLSLKGMDENIRYECDRDIYIRCLDGSKTIMHNPAVISRHHIPDQKKKDNMSTLVSVYEKRLYQVNVYEKGILLCSNQSIVSHCRKGLSYIFKHIVDEQVKNGSIELAAVYARKALSLSFGLKWCVYSLYLSLRAVF